MSKIFRTVVASSVIGGVALLSPLSAQARALTPIAPNPVYASCLDSSSLQGHVVGKNWSVVVPTTVLGANARTLNYRVRSYNDGAGGKSVVVADKVRAGAFTDNGN